MSKNIHDVYGKKLFESIQGFTSEYQKCNSLYEDEGRGARIDGVIDDRIAIEIESRVSKQIRGAILDLYLHKNPKKLLILIPVHMTNPTITLSQCTYLLGKLCSKNDFEVVLLKGTGNNYMLQEDKKLIENALKRLG